MERGEHFWWEGDNIPLCLSLPSRGCHNALAEQPLRITACPAHGTDEFLKRAWSYRRERKRAGISMPSLHLLQMKGLGIIIQDSYFKAAFQLCKGNLSVMLLGELGDRAAVTAPATAGTWAATAEGGQCPPGSCSSCLG